MEIELKLSFNIYNRYMREIIITIIIFIQLLRPIILKKSLVPSKLLPFFQSIQSKFKTRDNQLTLNNLKTTFQIATVILVQSCACVDSLQPNIESFPTPLERERYVYSKNKYINDLNLAIRVETELNNVYFNYKSSNIEKSEVEVLKRNVEILKKYPHLSITLIGHTDDFGSDSFNQKLAFNRSQSVYSFLIKNGVNAKNIIIKSPKSVFSKKANNSLFNSIYEKDFHKFKTLKNLDRRVSFTVENQLN